MPADGAQREPVPVAWDLRPGAARAEGGGALVVGAAEGLAASLGAGGGGADVDVRLWRVYVRAQPLPREAAVLDEVVAAVEGSVQALGGAPPRLVLVGPVGLEREMAAASLRPGEIVVRPRPAKGFPPRLRGLAHRGPAEPVQALRLVPGEVLARVRCRVGSVTLAREEVFDGERSDGLQSVGAGKCDGGFGAKRADLLTPERAERAPVDGAYGVHAAKVLVRAQGGSPGLEQRGGHGSHAAADPKTSDSRDSAARFRPSTSDSSAFLDARDLPRCVRARGRESTFVVCFTSAAATPALSRKPGRARSAPLRCEAPRVRSSQEVPKRSSFWLPTSAVRTARVNVGEWC